MKDSDIVWSVRRRTEVHKRTAQINDLREHKRCSFCGTV